MWYKLQKIRRSELDEISAEVCIPQTSPWFDGHFPGEPVLPGVAQIGMVYDVVQKASDSKLNLSSVSRVRFKRIVRPGDLLNVIISPMQRAVGANSFRILIRDELVCNGVMTFAQDLGRAEVKDRGGTR